MLDKLPPELSRKIICYLDKSDFRTAFNFNINPGINSLRNAKFSRNTLDGLLSNTKIIIE